MGGRQSSWLEFAHSGAFAVELSWARLGASVVGCDLADAAIESARALAQELALPARFVRCNVYDLPTQLEEKFDIVFTSYGSIGWLPDLTAWAGVVKHFLKPGGFFYMVDFHPVVWMFDSEFQKIEFAYHNTGPIATDNSGSYTDRNADIHYRDYGWNHSLSEILNSLLGQRLRLEFLNEFPYSPYAVFSRCVRGADGNYRIEGMEDKIPMLYSLKASLPDDLGTSKSASAPAKLNRNGPILRENFTAIGPTFVAKCDHGKSHLRPQSPESAMDSGWQRPLALVYSSDRCHGPSRLSRH